MKSVTSREVEKIYKIGKATIFDMDSGDITKFRLGYNPLLRSEINVQEYYQKIGYKAFTCGANGIMTLDERDVGEAIKLYGKKIKITNSKTGKRNNKGIPDLIVFNKRKGEVFFVEVKTRRDVIHIHQFEYWMYCKIPVKIFIFDRVKKPK
jgi:hypothetical protein